jgi:glucans biosynthesis protein
MKSLLPFAALIIAASLSPAQVALESVKGFADLEKVAVQLALQPYKAPTQHLDPFFEGLKYDGHRQIRFLRDKALFAEQGDTFRVEFFHPGWMFKKPVVFYDMQGPQTVSVPFDRSHFNYGDLKVPADVKRAGT